MLSTFSKAVAVNAKSLLYVNNFNCNAVRTTYSFFGSRNAKELWKCVTSVTNQGRMRGRAKGMMRIKNLNRGQRLGFGQERILFPGLSKEVTDKERKPTQISQAPQEAYDKYLEEYQLAKTSQTQSKKGRKRLSPLERGWTSASIQGKGFGAPISTHPDGNFNDFDSILIETRVLVPMTSLFGRTRKTRLCMITGNRNGLLGYTVMQARFGGGGRTYQRALNRAGKRVCFFDRYENRTVYHDFFSQFGASRVFVQQKPPGYGVSAHRIIVAVCELVGIKDIRVTIEGRINPLNVLKAFLLGLLRQRTHQALANEKRLHLVEFREEMGNFPLVVASPEDGVVRTEAEISKDEILDFEMVSFDGHLPKIQPPRTPTPKAPQWKIKVAPYQSHPEDQRRLNVEEGEVRSFLTNKFPECRPTKIIPKSKQAKEANLEQQ